jgi:hypothetical protein
MPYLTPRYDGQDPEPDDNTFHCALLRDLKHLIRSRRTPGRTKPIVFETPPSKPAKHPPRTQKISHANIEKSHLQGQGPLNPTRPSNRLPRQTPLHHPPQLRTQRPHRALHPPLTVLPTQPLGTPAVLETPSLPTPPHTLSDSAIHVHIPAHTIPRPRPHL